MKKSVLVLLTLMLSVSLSYAQTAPARNASGAVVTHARTNYTNLGVLGQDTLGNPGYIVLTGSSNNAVSYLPEYYLWVNASGKLCIASGPVITNNSNFPDGNWSNFPAGYCTVVGGQS